MKKSMRLVLPRSCLNTVSWSLISMCTLAMNGCSSLLRANSRSEVITTYRCSALDEWKTGISDRRCCNVALPNNTAMSCRVFADSVLSLRTEILAFSSCNSVQFYHPHPCCPLWSTAHLISLRSTWFMLSTCTQQCILFQESSLLGCGSMCIC